MEDMKNTKSTKTTEKLDPIKLRDLILKAPDLPTKPVEVPEWGVTVYIRSMTAKERDDWQAAQFVENAEGDRVMSIENISASMLVRVLCSDPEGKVRIFSDDDADQLGDKSAKALNRLQEAARDLNGVSEEDEKAILKNSGGLEEVSG